MNVYLQDMGLVCALGCGADAVRRALLSAVPASGLTLTDRYSPGRMRYVGEVSLALPDLGHAAPQHRVRNNALAAAALAQVRPSVQAAIERYGARRVAIVVGTSTSGVIEGECALGHRQETGMWPASYSYGQQELGNLAAFIAAEIGTTGIAHVISTACSSSAKAMASAARLLAAGYADAVITGGCDVLSKFTLAGFDALHSLSAAQSLPLSHNRDGINLGEGAAFFLMGKEPGPVRLAGWGESSDAYHMSAPDPTGRGALTAMTDAVGRAGLTTAAIDYVNLHGTGTKHNDEMESLAVAELLGAEVFVSSSKPLSGHTLAAAGALEAGFAWLTLVDNPRGLLPPHWWDGVRDPSLSALRIVAPGESLGRPVRYVLSNSFAFGGSNAALVLGTG